MRYLYCFILECEDNNSKKVHYHFFEMIYRVGNEYD